MVLSLATGASAQQRSLIRDAEIEATIRDLATPLFQAAGLNPEAVSIYIINDDRLNAFVAGGQNLFLNTGLLMAMRSPLELIGVVAHETGHIAGGHLARTSDAIAAASNTALLSAIVGVATAVATGRADAGAAIALGGQSAALGSFLQYSRAQESAADQAALRFLDDTGQSARGLARFFEELASQELLSASRQSPYMSTHPFTRDRLNTVEAHVQQSKYADVPATPEQTARFERVVAKLHGFIRAPSQTFRKYPETDTSVPARLARAIAYREVPDYPKAIALTRELIAEDPDDPYLHELEGQLLFETGKIDEAVPPLEKANALAPQAGLIEISLAQALLARNDPASDQKARDHLQNAKRSESDWPFLWRQLATAQGRLGDIGQAALSLSEEAVRQSNWEAAEIQSKRAQTMLKAGTPAMLRALDIEELAKRERAAKRKK
ncbi:MAG: M48 family metalloprotease [Thalassobaculaceae bacterium]|nr:M48 family metalloprotease [Thalassobaculaceae bacterium]